MKKLVICLFAIVTQTIFGQDKVFLKDQIIKVDKKNDRTLTIEWDDYFYTVYEEEKTFLSEIKSVKHDGNKLKLYGYIPKKSQINDDYPKNYKNTYEDLEENDLYEVILELRRDRNFVLKEKIGFSFKNFLKSASLLTIPYKIRPGNDDLKRITTSGLKNLAVNFDLIRGRREIYYQSGKKLLMRASIGVIISPTVEEFSDSQRNGFPSDATGEQNELFLSTGLSFNLSFNDIAFSFIPIGHDHATSTIGKSWKYNGRRWWGFGIGLSPKFLGPANSK
ncbi:hypothetical protein [Flagellimonas okinawensis]|uniref:DUF2490 domain-containing protein n=1 Tax=Flagellimonas okinawensis TaxID=3031324 RepID=A0ABT5XIN0_9FLAO|nr:hypothetical protein [[Muricauda] okinawensis]MDF0705721.1 hypothetical protein [[Muricauda] okinawensis]